MGATLCQSAMGQLPITEGVCSHLHKVMDK